LISKHFHRLIALLSGPQENKVSHPRPVQTAAQENNRRAKLLMQKDFHVF
jgi:hypothetical protein